MTQKFEKLKTLLRELFQLDHPDLDFGLYRIMHAKAAEVTQFLERDLLPQVKEEFAKYKTADKAEIEQQLAKAIEQALSLGADPESLPKVKELRSRLSGDAVDLNGLESEVYDHLYGFFRRYYSEGDFLSKRVYKPGVYAIPYEGEEVKLHWANADQFYIKTSEYLRDYAFRLRPEDKVNPMRVHFRLVDAAEGEHGNVKAAEGKDRIFILAVNDFIAEEDGEHGKELVIRFEYRPATLSDWPHDVRDSKKRPPTQKDMTNLAEARIATETDKGLTNWATELVKRHEKADGELADYSRLHAHLSRYVGRNTFDYFIHKDLKAFLRRELDFYVKNEVMHLDDIERETVYRVEQYLSKIKVIRRIAGKLIDFLASIEDFQKKLWSKKKFVVETNYCVAVGSVPESFYPEIAANDRQREDWVRLFSIDQITEDLTGPGFSTPLTVQFIEAHPTLLVDTCNFSAEFTARLLDAMEMLDDNTDGVLFHSENYQALGLAQDKYRRRIGAVYIDPPYNTGPTEIVYKNNYKNSSWLSLMQDRMIASINLLQDDACYAIAIDDYEMVHLCEIADEIFKGFNRHMVVVNHHPQGGMSHNLTRTHEYMLMMTPQGCDILRGKKKSGEIEYRSFMLSGPGENKSRSGRPNSFYAVLIDESAGQICGFEPPPAGNTYPTGRTSEGYARRYPLSPAGDEKVWCRAYTSAAECLARGEITLSDGGTLKLAVSTEDKRHSLMSNWTDSRYNAGPHGTALVSHILGDREAFSYPKSLHTVRDAVESMTWHFEDPIVLDFFGGSGTTGHAVVQLNREDGGRRKFVMMEMGDYFDKVTLPRVKKISFAPEWTDGKPARMPTQEEAERSPRIIKYLRLESYEDTLNNLQLRRSKTQQLLLDATRNPEASTFKEQYMVGYMLNIESEGSQSLLNVSAFIDPTAYKLKVKRAGSDESREVNVDLLETFNWLIGLTVQHIAAPQCFDAKFERDSENRFQIKGRLKQVDSSDHWFRTVIGKTPDGRKSLVIWRKRPGGETPEGVEKDNLVLDEWFTRQGFSSKDSEFDLIYVNGTNNLENLRVPDDTWKVRLIEDDFHRLMFASEAL
jgi:adenine-specific DNA-methyltransferase